MEQRAQTTTNNFSPVNILFLRTGPSKNIRYFRDRQTRYFHLFSSSCFLLVGGVKANIYRVWDFDPTILGLLSLSLLLLTHTFSTTPSICGSVETRSSYLPEMRCASWIFFVGALHPVGVFLSLLLPPCVLIFFLSSDGSSSSAARAVLELEPTS